MIDVDKWQEIFESINRHRLRTLLTAFGVAWGIFMLVMLLGMGNGLQNGIKHQFEGDALNSLWINTGRTSKSHNGLGEGRLIRLNNDDYKYLISQFDEISKISGKYFLSWSSVVTHGQKSQTYSVQGTHPDGAYIESLELLSGRYFHNEDLNKLRKVAVIGRDVKDEFFGDDIDPIGQSIVIDGNSYQVIGVFYDKEEGRTMQRVYVPISTLQTNYSNFRRIDQMIIDLGDLGYEEVIEVEEAVKRTLQERKLIHPEDRQAIRIWNMAEEFQGFKSLMNAIKGIMWIVGIFSIIAGVIGVSNIMLIIVKDRTKEIGIRKALGATPRSIVSMIFQESIFITAIAGYIGLVLGIAALAGLSFLETEFFRRPEINIWIAITATLILILAGALAGLLPAIQASRINPVQAIKSD